MDPVPRATGSYAFVVGLKDEHVVIDLRFTPNTLDKLSDVLTARMPARTREGVDELLGAARYGAHRLTCEPLDVYPISAVLEELGLAEGA